MNTYDREYSNYYYLMNNINDLKIDLNILLDKNLETEILKNEVLKLLKKYQNKINKDFINENKGKFLY